MTTTPKHKHKPYSISNKKAGFVHFCKICERRLYINKKGVWATFPIVKIYKVKGV